MTHPSIIAARREKALVRFEEALASLGTDDWRTDGGSRVVPATDDRLGNHAYNAAAFVALAEALAAQQERISELEAQLRKPSRSS